jgi:hypothetical protein
LAPSGVAGLAESADGAIAAVEKQLPPGFPEEIHAAVSRGLRGRLAKL